MFIKSVKAYQNDRNLIHNLPNFEKKKAITY